MSDELKAAFASLDEMDLTSPAAPAGCNDDDPQALKAEIERLHLEYGDQVLANIKLNQAKRHSVQLAERWQREAESLRTQLREAQNRKPHDSDDERDEYDEDEAETQGKGKVKGDGDGDGEEEEEEDAEKLKEQITSLGFELGDEILRNARLNSERRASMQLVEKWKREAEDLRKLLADRQVVEDPAVEVIKERRKSVAAIEAFQQEVESLRRLLGDEANNVPKTDLDQVAQLLAAGEWTTGGPHDELTQEDLITLGMAEDSEFMVTEIGAEDLETKDQETETIGDDSHIRDEEKVRLWQEVEKLGYELGDEILKNVRLKNEKRQSIALAQKYRAEAEKLKGLLNNSESQLHDVVKDQITQEVHAKFRAKYAEMLEHNKSQVQSMELRMRQVKEENALLRRSIDLLHAQNGRLREEKMALILTTSQALDETRNIIRTLGRRQRVPQG